MIKFYLSLIQTQIDLGVILHLEYFRYKKKYKHLFIVGYGHLLMEL